MRETATILTWILFGTIPLSLADPPAPKTTEATAPSTSSSAAPPAASPSQIDPREKVLLRMGFRPRMQNGQKVFCKREQELGSRVEGTMLCGTVDHLMTEFRLSREAIDQTQRYGTNPTGH
jgi:hypothetical protein